MLRFVCPIKSRFHKKINMYFKSCPVQQILEIRPIFILAMQNKAKKIGPTNHTMNARSKRYDMSIMKETFTISVNLRIAKKCVLHV